MAQIALNNNASETMGLTLFYGNFGKHLNLFIDKGTRPMTCLAITKSEELKMSHDRMKGAIIREQKRLTSLRYKDLKTAPQFKKGDRVYLLTKNLKTQRNTKKLDYVKVGPFLINEVKGPNNYRLDLLADARIYPTFYISMLEPADKDIPLQTTFHFEPQEEDEFEVEKIVD